MKRQTQANSLHNSADPIGNRSPVDKGLKGSFLKSLPKKVDVKQLIYALSLSCLLLSACSSLKTAPAREASRQEEQSSVSSRDLDSNGQAEILQAQAQQAHKVEVLFSARVKKLLPDDTEGLPHQLFLLDLDNGSTVKVAHDTKYAPRLPIQPGDRLTIKGEYIWNKRGGVVHWTHHSDTPRHEGGYIEFGGQRYE